MTINACLDGRPARLVATLLACAWPWGSGPSAASDHTAARALEDARHYFSAPLRWDGTQWSTFGLSVAAVVVAHEYDDEVRSHFIDGGHAASPGRDPRSLKDALPAVILFAGTLAAAAVTHNDSGYDEAWAMTEATALSGVTALALKYSFGRERPNDTAAADDWFSGGDSLPSMHTTVAFAVGTVLAESGSDQYRWVRRTLGYGAAAGTAYLRMRDNVHWLSDTVAGAALGIASAEFAMHRRSAGRAHGAMTLSPFADGVMISYSWPLD